MSVQLILYPQSYNGLNSLSGAGTEHVVDGINFNTINSSTTSLSLAAPTYQSAINALNASMVVNTWYRFSSSATPPTESSGTVGIVAQQGIVQKLSNLIIGQIYDVTIETTASTLTFYYQYYCYLLNRNKCSNICISSTSGSESKWCYTRLSNRASYLRPL